MTSGSKASLNLNIVILDPIASPATDSLILGFF